PTGLRRCPNGLPVFRFQHYSARHTRTSAYCYPILCQNVTVLDILVTVGAHGHSYPAEPCTLRGSDDRPGHHRFDLRKFCFDLGADPQDPARPPRHNLSLCCHRDRDRHWPALRPSVILACRVLFPFLLLWMALLKLPGLFLAPHVMVS